MSDDLDRLLSRSLDEPADAGFSARVVARAAYAESQRRMLEDIAMILAAALVVALLPLTHIGQTFAQTASQLAFSAAFATGCGLLLLTWFAIRALPD